MCSKEQFSAFDFKVKRVPIILQERGLARGAQALTDTLNKIKEGIAGEWIDISLKMLILLVGVNSLLLNQQ